MSQRLVETPGKDHINRALWTVARRKGLSRRHFLRLLALGGTAAVVAACRDVESTPTPAPDGEPNGFAKDPSPFIPRGTNLETRLELLDGWITPNELFFVRNNSPLSPRIDAGTWRLRVQGDAILEPLELTIDEIRKMPSRTVPAYIECAGNGRSLFDLIMGQPASGGEWITGGVSMATWTGVPLSHILELAGIQANAFHVNIQGLDEEAPEGGFQRPMTVEKAMHPDTIMAYVMNGDELPVDHGYPLRAVVPGWVGSNSIKWAGTITVSSEPIYVRNNTTSYVLEGPEWPPEQFAPAIGEPVTEQSIKSALALPWEAELQAGPQMIRGFAYGPGTIQRVEWSEDSGQSWQEARVISPQLDNAWVRFEFEWDAPAGATGLMTRAYDTQGNTQPDSIPFNQQGYLFNMLYDHPLTVS
jgi:sulfane dehydrogenase subunit SoxC